MFARGQRGSDMPIARPIVRPPLLFLACLLLGFILDHVAPFPFAMPENALVYRAAGAGLIIFGVAIFAAGVRNFSRTRTPVPSTRPARTLVTTGIHGLSRNPIYVGMFAFYTGIGVAVRGPWLLLLLVGIGIILRYGVVSREEAYLEARFGAAYRDYKGRVRRWL